MLSRSLFTVVVLCLTMLGLFSACGSEPATIQPSSQSESQTKPEPGIRDTGTGLEITNPSDEFLTIRAAFVIPIEGGNVGVCNPYGPPGNRTVPLPEDPQSPYDQVLPPAQTIKIPSESCPNYIGYSVWARNSNGELVFEEHK